MITIKEVKTVNHFQYTFIYPWNQEILVQLFLFLFTCRVLANKQHISYGFKHAVFSFPLHLTSPYLIWVTRLAYKAPTWTSVCEYLMQVALTPTRRRPETIWIFQRIFPSWPFGKTHSHDSAVCKTRHIWLMLWPTTLLSKGKKKHFVCYMMCISTQAKPTITALLLCVLKIHYRLQLICDTAVLT